MWSFLCGKLFAVCRSNFLRLKLGHSYICYFYNMFCKHPSIKNFVDLYEYLFTLWWTLRQRYSLFLYKCQLSFHSLLSKISKLRITAKIILLRKLHVCKHLKIRHTCAYLASNENNKMVDEKGILIMKWLFKGKNEQ